MRQKYNSGNPQYDFSNGSSRTLEPSKYGPYNLSVSIENKGEIESKNVTLTLTLNDKEVSKEVFDTLGPHDPKGITFNYDLPDGGPNKIKIQLQGSGPEATPDNNQFDLTYTVQ